MNSLPIDNQKPGITVVNIFNREINDDLKKDINDHLTEVAEQSNRKPKDIVDKLNNEDGESGVKIRVQNFTSAIPTDLTFTKASENLEVVQKFSNSTFTQLKVQEKDNDNNKSNNSTESDDSDDSSEESGSGSDEAFGCDAAALDEAVKQYYATTETFYDPDNETETTTPSSSTVESNILKIGSSKSVPNLTTSTEISTKIVENDSESSSTNISESSKSITIESSTSLSSTTVSSTTEKDKAMEVMKKIQEVSADPVIFTQGV